jgi:uncharacterized protein involved in exopolysaccharide biosynthesis
VVVDDVLRGLREHWFFCAVGVVLGGVVGFAATYLRTPVYQAEVILAPAATRSTNSGLTSLLGPLQGVSRLPLSLGDDTSGLSDRAVAVLRSRAFTEKFVQSNGLVETLTPGSRLGSLLGRGPPSPAIRLYQAALVFRTSIVAVRVDTRSSFVTIAVRWKNAEEAAEWANELAAAANEEARERAIADADNAINYLQEELKVQSAVPIVAAINQLIESQLHNKMLAKTRPQFVYTILSPAMPSPPGAFVSPDRPLVALAVAVAGGLFALYLVMRRRA